MLGSLFLGTALAIIHHVFYLRLNGNVVKSSDEQTWAFRIGTGLAFLVKAFLSVAVSIACVQHFWWILRRKPIQLSKVDSMYDILGNAWTFLDKNLWFGGPGVAMLAGIVWYV
jgi:hypothetical protein